MTALAARAVMAMLTLIYALVAMVSCTVSAPPVAVELPVADVPQQQARTLRILSVRGEEGYALQQAADRFAAAHPGVTVQLQTIGEESDYRSALRTRLIGTEQPVDLFHIHGRQELEELRPHLRDLSGLDWVGEIAQDFILEPVRADGAVYGVPHSLEGLGLLVNRDIFAAVGLDPDDIDSLEALDEALGELREQIGAGELAEDWPALEAAVSFPALNLSAGEQLGELLLTGAFAAAEGAVAAKSVAPPLAKEVGEYVDIMARHAAAGRGWSRLNETAESAAVEALATGRVAVIQGGTAVWTAVARRSSEVAARLRLLPVPLGEEGEGAVYVGAPVYWAVNADADPDSAALAEAFLTWLYTAEEGKLLLAEEFAVLSPYEAEASTGIGLHAQLLRYLRGGRAAPSLWREAPAGWTAAVHEQLREYFGVLDKSWENVVDSLCEAWLGMRIGR